MSDPFNVNAGSLKMVKLGNLEIVAAGDISNFDKEVKKNMSEQNKDLKPGSREIDTENPHRFKGGFYR